MVPPTYAPLVLTVFLRWALSVDARLAVPPQAPQARLGRADAADKLEVTTEDSQGDGEGLGWMNGVLYRMAQREENMNPSGPPYDVYGPRYLVKIPRSFVGKIAELRKRGHTRRFNFIGALRDLSTASKYPPGVREWVPPFVKQHFGDKDYYQDTNPLSGYQLIGQFDHTLDKRNFTKQQKFYANDQVPFDEKYFATLCQSELTLAPAGDLPYSYRFLEAILCGSIPIVNEEKYANCEHHQYWMKPKLSEKIGWHYYLANDDPNFTYAYNTTWVEENLQKALRFHTFIEGWHDDELCGPHAENCP